MISFRKYCLLKEAYPSWLLHNKYEQALQQLRNSVYFKRQRFDPKNLNLSRDQAKTIFGNDFTDLMNAGILTVKPKIDHNPFGADTPSYTITMPTDI